MPTRKAVLRHQYGDHNANLIWGPPLPPAEEAQLPASCGAMRERGYEVALYHEGDGASLHHAQYTPAQAIADVRSCFTWLDVADRDREESELYACIDVECTILVPVECLTLDALINLPPYRFIPAIADDGGDDHPWHDYLSPAGAAQLYAAREKARRDGVLGLTREDLLLTYPLVETRAQLPMTELLAAQQAGDGPSPLLRRCAEVCDRGLDLVRYREVTYRQLERSCGLAGQLLGGFHAAYVIPANGPITPRLYCHFATPISAMPNWIGLHVDWSDDAELAPLAPVVHAAHGQEMALRLRATLRAVGQAFYVLTPEVRFVGLLVAVDALCAPEKGWAGLSHRAYVAAVASGGDPAKFRTWLHEFDDAYSNVRNPVVHRGASFIELSADVALYCDRIVSLLKDCIESIAASAHQTSAQLRAACVSALTNGVLAPEIQQYVNATNSSLAPGAKPIKSPKW